MRLGGSMSKIEELNRKLERLNLVGYWNIPRGEARRWKERSTEAPLMQRLRSGALSKEALGLFFRNRASMAESMCSGIRGPFSARMHLDPAQLHSPSERSMSIVSKARMDWFESVRLNGLYKTSGIVKEIDDRAVSLLIISSAMKFLRWWFGFRFLSATPTAPISCGAQSRLRSWTTRGSFLVHKKSGTIPHSL